MPLRPRSLQAAGVIAVLATLAFVRHWPFEPAGGALPKTVVAPADFASARVRAPASAGAVASAASDEAALAGLLRSARFGELLRRASALENAERRERWLESCTRLAPPPLLAEEALRLPPGPHRQHLLAQAVERWVLDDPDALAEWAVQHLADAPELDLALARIVEHTDTLQRPTATALVLAGLVQDPALRLRALRAAVAEWADSDPDSALRFARAQPGLSAAERSALLALFTPFVSET